MNVSPVQLHQLFFTRSHIEIDYKHLPEEAPNHVNDVYSFEGVLVEIGMGFELLEGDSYPGVAFMGHMRVIIDNSKNADAPGRKYSPYNVSIEARAIITVDPEAIKIAPIKALARVNGAALIWGSIREHVSSITARMPANAIVLPSMNFRGVEVEDQVKSKEIASKAPSKSGRKKAEISKQ